MSRYKCRKEGRKEGRTGRKGEKERRYGGREGE